VNTILVEIAAYRDDELPKTVASLLKNARYPERLRFAIVHQFGPETAGCIDEYKTDTRFKIVEQPWYEARGVGVARRKCDELYDDEDFYLQIDSHMRCKDSWDDRLEAEWIALSDSRAILSSYPPAYRYDNNDREIFVSSEPNRLVVHDMFMGDIPVFFGKALPKDAPRRGAFVAGGLQFGPGKICREVPYEPRICFIGEEIVHSLRLFAAGYHIYSVDDQVISHLYIRSENQKNAHHFWKDFTESEELKEVYAQMNKLSYGVVREYLSVDQTPVSPGTLASFEDFAGVEFARRLVHPDTYHTPPLPMAVDAGWKQSAIPPQKQS